MYRVGHLIDGNLIVSHEAPLRGLDSMDVKKMDKLFLSLA
jgi:hypothetical protein